MIEKTNVMRIIEQKKIDYKTHYYGDTSAISGIEVATVLNEDPSTVFKTLVCKGKSNQSYVFVIPVTKELDLKKAAKSVNEKSIELIPLAQLLPLTGYVHGGCSPIGMKKYFTTVVDESAKNHQTIIFSGGKIGYQVELSVDNLSKIIKLSWSDLTS